MANSWVAACHSRRKSASLQIPALSTFQRLFVAAAIVKFRPRWSRRARAQQGGRQRHFLDHTERFPRLPQGRHAPLARHRFIAQLYRQLDADRLMY